MTTFAPTDKASSRTKNRLREHPDLVDTGERSNHIMGFGTRMMGLFKVPEANGWIGWLPLDEVDGASD
jgi:hypothetical protein